MNRLALILGIGALVAPANLLAVTAQAGKWTRGCQSASTISAVHGGEWACYTPATGAATDSASPILDVSQCDNIDVFLSDDHTGAGATCSVTWGMDQCPAGAAALASDALKNVACAALPGFTTLDGALTNGVDVESNLAGMFVRVRGGGAGANITSCQIMVKCALPSEAH